MYMKEFFRTRGRGDTEVDKTRHPGHSLTPFKYKTSTDFMSNIRTTTKIISNDQEDLL